MALYTSLLLLLLFVQTQAEEDKNSEIDEDNANNNPRSVEINDDNSWSDEFTAENHSDSGQGYADVDSRPGPVPRPPDDDGQSQPDSAIYAVVDHRLRKQK